MYSYLHTHLFLFIYAFTLIYIPNYNYLFIYVFQILFSFAYLCVDKFFLGATLVCQWLGSILYLSVYRQLDQSRNYLIGNNTVVINPALTVY